MGVKNVYKNLESANPIEDLKEKCIFFNYLM